MKILITGGAGCLGSNIVEHFLPLGHEILVIDNFTTGKKETLSGIENLKIVEGDICNETLMDKCFYDFSPTHVIHSAASYKDPLDWEQDSRTNIIGSIILAKLCQKYPPFKIINFQTSLCYGRPNQVPIPISHPNAPFTSYGISKTAGEEYLLNSKLPVVSLRLANICGPRLSIGPIPTFYQRIKNKKSCFCSDSVRDFLDISDFLSLLELVLKRDSPNGKFNVSTGKGKSISQVFNTVAKYLNSKPAKPPIIPVGDDDVKSVVLDPSETEKIFGWKAKVSFKETVNNQLIWYDKYGISAIYSHLSNKSN